MSEQNKKPNCKHLKSGERQVQTDIRKIDPFHLWRYKEAMKYVQGHSVLDMGCGVGYGTYLLSTVAKNVVGIDDSQDAIDFACRHYVKDKSNITYEKKDVFDLTVQCDTVVTFELIEHIKDDQKLFDLLDKLATRRIIFSVPHISQPLHPLQYHWRHYSFDGVIDICRARNWSIKRMQVQHVKKGICVFAVVEKPVV